MQLRVFTRIQVTANASLSILFCHGIIYRIWSLWKTTKGFLGQILINKFICVYIKECVETILGQCDQIICFKNA